MLPRQYIEERGGKAAILDYVRDKTDLPIPKYEVIGFEDAPSKIARVFSDIQAPHAFGNPKPIIVRSSSPYEYGDFEGVFESVPGIRTWTGLLSAIEQIKASAQSDLAHRYARQKGIEIGEKICIILQQQSDSRYCGAMMRHPNNPSLIFIDYFESGYDWWQQLKQGGVWDDKKNEVVKGHFNLERANIEELIRAYKKIESLSDIADGCSLFVEFGLNPLFIYQVRPFMEFKTTNFEVPKFPRERLEFAIVADCVFGLTPPEGIEVPIVSHNSRVSSGFSYRGLSQKERESTQQNLSSADSKAHKPYCLVVPYSREQENWDLYVPRMNALIAGDSSHFLTHGMIRLLKKAEVSLLCDRNLSQSFLSMSGLEEKTVQIISNGREGVALLRCNL